MMDLHDNRSQDDASGSIYFEREAKSSDLFTQTFAPEESSSRNDVSTLTFENHHHSDFDVADFSTIGEENTLDYTPESSGGHPLSLTSNGSRKLRYDRLEIYGRQEEKNLLNECLERIMIEEKAVETAISNPSVDQPDNKNPPGNEIRNTKRNEICFISGVSGCGKSTLAKYMERIVGRKHGLYVEGKFAMNTKGEPLSGIKAACLQICGELLFLKGSDPDRFTVLIKHMKEALETELPVLLDFIPDLQDVLAQDLAHFKPGGSLVTDSDSAKIRLFLYFRRFMRFIARHFSLCLVLDDLQRADSASLEMILSTVTDADNPGFLLIGTYRSNEVESSLEEFIQGCRTLAQDSSSGLARVTEMELENFSVKQVQEVLAILFDMDNGDKIAQLAVICHKRTLGNMFYLKVFLSILKDDELVRFDPVLNSWDWNDTEIVASTAASGNTVDMMKTQLTEMLPAIQKRLSLAALLGSSFDLETECIVWESVRSELSVEGETDTWLSQSVNSGILEKLNDARFQWVHDKVQEAALALLSEEERPRMEYIVGHALLDNLSEEKIDSWLFTIVDLLNGHESRRPESRRQEANCCEAIELNRRASKKASDECAFSSAHHYARLAIDMLPQDAWQNHRQITLELYSLAANAAESISDKDNLEQYIDVVAQRKDLSIVEKSTVLQAKLNFCYREETPGAIEEGFQLLLFIMAEMKVTFPKRLVGKFLFSLGSFLRIKKKVLKLTEKDLLTRPPMTDPIKLKTMFFLGTQMNHVYITNPDLVGLWILRFGEMALDDGICLYSQTAIGQLGMVFFLAGDLDLAEKCGSLSEKLFLRSLAQGLSSVHACYQTYGGCLSFKRPYKDLIGKLKETSLKDMAAGDIMSSSGGILFYVFMAFQAGWPLATVEDMCRVVVIQMKEWKNEHEGSEVVMLWQVVLNLLGARPRSPSTMQGKAIEDYPAFKASLSLEIQIALLRHLQGFLYVIFEEYERAEELLFDDEDRFQRAAPAMFVNMHEAFVRGLCWFGLARKTRQAKYKKGGKRILSTFSSWVKNGNPNVLHLEQLFKAELAALNGRMAEADLCYHKAFQLALKSDLVHDAAIISERCGDFFENVQRKSPGYAIHKIEEACKFYEEWGCRLKADMLRHKYGLNKPSSISKAIVCPK